MRKWKTREDKRRKWNKNGRREEKGEREVKVLQSISS